MLDSVQDQPHSREMRGEREARMLDKVDAPQINKTTQIDCPLSADP